MDQTQLITIVVTIVSTFVASSGFWAWLQSKDTQKSATTRLLMGLAYDKITYLGMKYIERGWISKDEYEDFRRYFFEPYMEYGGNGMAERIMNEVSGLPLRHYNLRAEIDRVKRESQDNQDA